MPCRSALQAAAMRSNHIMWAMGEDFAYSNALTWYKNMDKLIHYVNKVRQTVSWRSAIHVACVASRWRTRGLSLCSTPQHRLPRAGCAFPRSLRPLD